MIKIIIIILVILNIYTLNAQDIEPTAWQFKWGYSDSPRVFEPDSFKQTSMFTGFQWYGSRKMNDALLNNIRAAGSYIFGSGNEENPLYLVHQPYWIDSSSYEPAYFYAPFMQYEPTLLLNDTTVGKILRSADPSDPVFSFEHVKGTILSDTSEVNYSRLILYKDSLGSYGSDTVLMNIWPQPQFTTRELRSEKNI
ncbi:MAG TPA: hypothetical protein PKY56_09675 [Candidatus Kapabacteria bacterium]|mgnify:FL=1|nr:hypothetical protein [Candidatus Kapabacteria bacterium]